MKVQLECPVCMNSLFEAAQIDCSTPNCSAERLCGNCNPGGAPSSASGPQPAKRGKKGPVNTFAKSTALTDISVTPCGHLFHSRCLKKWFAESCEKPSCPNCRTPFGIARIYQVYLDYSSANTSSHDLYFSDPSPGTSAGCQPPVLTPVIDLDSLDDVNPTMYEGHSFEDLKVIHSTLISDFNDLKTRYLELQEDHDLSRAQIMSLECEIDSLKAQLSVSKNVSVISTIPESTVHTTKRPSSREVQARGSKRSKSSDISRPRPPALD